MSYATLAQAAADHAITENYGRFIQIVINFLVIALLMYLLTTTVSTLMEKMKRKEAAAAAAAAVAPPPPKTKKCTFCDSDISLLASRCPFCTSQLK